VKGVQAGGLGFPALRLPNRKDPPSSNTLDVMQASGLSPDDAAIRGSAHREGFVTLEPIQVRIRKAPQLIGESVTDLMAKGELDLFKDDKGHSYLLYSQLKERAAKRKHVKKPAEKPHLAAARDAYHARRKQQGRKRKASR
jgi:hypothetical protein